MNKYPVGTLIYDASNRLGIILGMVTGYKDKMPSRYVVHWFDSQWSCDYSERTIDIGVRGYRDMVGE